MKELEKISKVVPIPVGQKIFVTSNKKESINEGSRIILPGGAKQVDLIDVQTVKEVGLYLKAEKAGGQVTIEPGDIVRVNWNSPSFYRRKKTKKFENRNDGSGIEDTIEGSSMEFSVDMFDIDGEELMLIDKNDISFVWKADSLSDGTEIDKGE